MRRLHDTYLPRLALARSAEEEEAVGGAATAEMAQAVEKAGISVDQYDAILADARADPELADRIREHIFKTVQ